MKLLRFLLILSFPASLISCSTQQKIPNYLQDIKDTSGVEITVPELKIQKSDRLSIQVYSASTKPEMSDALYNLPVTGGTAAQGTTGGSGGLLVDGNGNIEYPRIGIIHAEGLTKLQLADVIKRKINEKDSVLTNPSVIINFQNLKVSVLGEVKSPGVITFPNERMTILEAIGMAGDVTDFGMKNSVKIVRETNGKRETGIVDLSSKDIFSSPYYNLVQNDLVIVEPSGRKAKKADQDVLIQRVGFGLSIITAMALVYNIFR